MTATSDLTRGLALFSAELRFKDLPDEVIARIGLLVLDQVGVQLAGSTFDFSGIVRDYGLSQAREGPSTVIGGSTQLVPEWAAFINGTAGGGVELDDYHPASMAHPGCVAVPAVVAVAEMLGANGRDTVAALAVACEAIIRVGLALQPSMTRDRGFHSTSVQGVFGAALGVSRLLGADADTTASALGLAGSHASGLTEHFGSGGHAKRIQAGLAAMAGIRSASLAARGLSGPPTVLNANRGVMQAFAETTKPDVMLSGLGQQWELLGTAIKPYACAGLIHAPIDGIRSLMADGLRAEDVAEIVVGTHRQSLVAVGQIGPRPNDLTGAQFSMHASLAMTLVMGGNDVAQYRSFQATGFRDPEIVQLAERIRLELDPIADSAFPKSLLARVRVRRKDGVILERSSYGTGTPDLPISSDMIRAKFHRLATDVISDEAAKAVEHAIDALVQDAPVRAVLRPLRGVS